MDAPTAIRIFDALGKEPRVRILLALKRERTVGLATGKIQKRVNIAATTTFRHHLDALVSAGLIEREVRGRETYCRPRYDRIASAVSFLRKQGIADPNVAPRRDTRRNEWKRLMQAIKSNIR